MRILLVDDSNTMRKIEKRVLVKMGHEDVIEAEDGKIALQKLAEYNYDISLVLLDITMPNMSGIETLKKIRSNPASQKIPVMMCTSISGQEEVMEAISAGANNYVVKPFKTDELSEKINAILG
ncbi:MAG: response regulator [Lentisphaeria bacterium]|nr:response regulator [Lentisphaeria bacterium]NQZ68511.1 response regulator [Lentisphaeria bacterium]